MMKNKTYFDDHKETYKHEIEHAISFSGQGLDFYTEAKVMHLLKLVHSFLGDSESIDALDVGCGIGITDLMLSSCFRKLSGVDVEKGVIEKASKNNPTVDYKIYDGKTLPFADNRFDLVFAIGVMHHVPPVQWIDFLKEMGRVSKPRSLVVVFEHNPYNPLTRYVVSRVSIDANAVLITKNRLRNLAIESGLKPVSESYITFFPFRSKLFSYIEKRIEWLPLGAQYLVAAQKKVGSGDHEFSKK